MSLAQLSIRRPVFITCLVILLLTLGLMSLNKLPVDLFPEVTFPVIVINTSYPGASPEEVETLVSKVIEDQLNGIPGIKQIRSDNTEGSSQVVAEFTSQTDINYAEQQIRDQLGTVKRKLPDDVQDPKIKRIDPADNAILVLSLKSHLPKVTLYELADKMLKPKLEQINQVGLIEIFGSSGRQIHVDLDRTKLVDRGISATDVVNSIAAAGQNVPIGKVDQGFKEKIFRTLGEYRSLSDIGSVVVKFFGNEVPVTVNDLGKVIDTSAEIHSKTFINGEPGLLLMVYKQTGANTINVVNDVKKTILQLNKTLASQNRDLQITIARDGSKMIRENVKDVVESILIGIILTVLVVYLFLGSVRSTFITGLALPTSLIGALFLMHLAGFSINTMSLLALSLAVGLLVDDAIVVRENIFRHTQLGLNAKEAAVKGTKEVLLAVIATSLTVIAVFGPIGFLHGIVGGFFKEFGLTVCFAMIISLCDALTIAPMLSAYIGLSSKNKKLSFIPAQFNRWQNTLERYYEGVLKFVLRFPLTILFSAFCLFAISIYLAKYVPKTFVPAQENGEFVMSIELPPGFNLQATENITRQIEKEIRTNKEIATAVAIVGNRGEPNRAQFFINMVPSSERSLSTTALKDKIRKQVAHYQNVKIVVSDIDLVGGGQRPFNLNIMGGSLEELINVSQSVYTALKKNKGLLDPEISYKPGKPELQIVSNQTQLQRLGVASTAMGQELRTQIEGKTAAVYRVDGQEYDINVRLQPDQRDLEKNFNNTLIPNMNNLLVKLSDVAQPIQAKAPTTISRKDRQRYIAISADIAPNGSGMGGIMKEIDHYFLDHKLPSGMSYAFDGQAESFKELSQNMIIALSLGILFIYLVLASLYESFVTPLTIMLVLPLAACGAFFSLLITRHSLDIFSMIGCILLFGIATKNSILLVDYTRQLTAQGLKQEEAIIKAGITRLRPILMTTIALIAGMLPIAIGLNEASRQRTSMGIAVIGGLLSSTLLTLVVVPAAYSYVERFRQWTLRLFSKKTPSLDCTQELDLEDLQIDN